MQLTLVTATAMFLTAFSIFSGGVGVARAAGPLPDDYAAWTEADKVAQRKAGAEMLVTVREAIRSGKKEITVPKGHYRFAELNSDRRPAHIHWRGLEGVTLDFSGSMLWFEHPRTGIVLSRSKDTTLRNVTLDWDPLPFSQGRIAAIDHERATLEIKIDPGYLPTSEDLLKGGRWRGVAFNASGDRFKAGQGGYELGIDWDRKTAADTIECTFHGFYGKTMKELNLEAGDPIAIFPRLGRAIRIGGCDRATLENVTLHASPFVAIAQSGGLGQPTYRRVNIVRRPGTNRLMAGNADGINVANVQDGPIIEDCRIEYLGDDFINVHSAYGRVAWQSEPNKLVTSRLFGEAVDRIEAGHPVKMLLFDRKTSRPIGERMVVAVETIGPIELEAEMLFAGVPDNPWHSGNGAYIRPGRTERLHRITLDQAIGLDRDTMIVLPDFMSNGSVIRNVEGVGSLARGFRLQSPGVTVEDCKVTNTLGHGISLGGQPAYWGEGPYVQNATIRNNVLTNVCIGRTANEVGGIYIRQGGEYSDNRLQKNIEIRGNTVQDVGSSALVVRGVSGLVVADNLFSAFWTRPADPLRDPYPEALAGRGYGVVLESCDGVVFEGNQISEPGRFAEGDVFRARVESE